MTNSLYNEIDELRRQLAEERRLRAEWVAQQEPVAWVDFDRRPPDLHLKPTEGFMPLYAAPGAQDCVKLQSGEDGVWAHFHAGAQHFSYCLDNDWMAKKFCDAYRAMLAASKEKS